MRCPRPFLFAAALLLALACAAKDAPLRVKDLGKVQGWRDNVLVGTGIVTGLAGTGDSPANRATRQALSNVLSQFNLGVAPEQVNSRNVAVVMVSASLPALAREGDGLDVTVSSSGDARSLLGGNLLLTALRGPDGRIYALAQGPLSIGGHRYDANGNVVQKNHPTAGSIPNGATVEVGMAKRMAPPAQVTFVLAEPDYTTASRVVAAINSQVAPGIAHARDASGVEIEVPEGLRDELVGFLARVENVAVEPDRRARVVINERTGTVVAGGDVRISRIAISHGDLKISIASQNSVSQPSFAGRAGPGVVSALVTNTQLEVEEPVGVGFLASAGTVSDLVQALARMKTGTRDIISILRAVKAAGALHGELVVQ
ncbi:flagellar basal body P-ring protein FlgI [Ramlibacter alkalitolerans]|uniref:Flagellar P-ring protein n=1 Tax=Ramlibacter alkalitolerans TaxID=2039631 RepID=A0ABS1JT38_9BURK|nr:flagellar basal body P-ring protein FlgI [Ramlibacter alkalitolerans]MBL0427397.1 flagellar basal body P-ring protein FlgI [Ramlibacter alkalitolerans]